MGWEGLVDGGYVGMHVCLLGGGGLLTAMAVELLTKKSTPVCGTNRRLYNILVMRKLFNKQLLPNLEQALSRTSTTKILDRTF